MRRSSHGLAVLLLAAIAQSIEHPAAAASAASRPLVVVMLPPSQSSFVIDDAPVDGNAKRAWGRLFARHGFTDGRHIDVAVVRTEPDKGTAALQVLARKVGAMQPAVIVVRGIAPLYALQAAGVSAPVACFDCGIGDAIAGDFIRSPRRPGSNVTGVAQPVVEVQEKRLEMLKEIMPAARRMGILATGPSPGLGEERARHRAAIVDAHQARMAATARRLGMEAVIVKVGLHDSGPAVARALRDARVDIVDFMGFAAPPGLWESLVEFRIASSKPAMRDGDGDGDPDALLGYISVDYIESLGAIVARILRGESPASIPPEGPREFRLVVNMRTARALGLTVPASILLRAQKVIE